MSALPADLTPSQDERILGALAHIGVLIPAVGVVIPILVWITQKERTRFAAFQALQAIAYQLLLIIAALLGMGCYFLSFLVAFGFIQSAGSSTSWVSMLPFFIPFCVLGGLGLVWIASILYALIGALLTFQGKDFRYLLLGAWVHRFLQQ